MTRNSTPRPRADLSRRTLLTAAAAGLALGAVGAPPAHAAPSYSPIPLLPGEVTRTDTRLTRLKKKPYECIDVVLLGDRGRIFVPHAAIPRSTTSQGIVWFYHSNGSTHTSLDGAYKYGAEMAVDEGAICVCPDYGGSLWTTATAIQHQVNWSTYMNSVWRLGINFMRANSGGGPLMTWAYGNALVPRTAGIYLANAAYDMEDLYDRDPVRIGPVYNYDRDAVIATNPARLPQSAWKNSRIKTVVSLADVVVPPDRHGLALVATAGPVARDTRVQYHNEGHVVPGWTQNDMIATFKSWM